jgi:hypothetical protein
MAMVKSTASLRTTIIPLIHLRPAHRVDKESLPYQDFQDILPDVLVVLGGA